VLVGVIAATTAMWCLGALLVGLALHWPVIVLGCLAAVVAGGTVTSAVVFRVIRRQDRH
jgi:hypothetical protein